MTVKTGKGKNGKWYSYLPKEGVEPPKGKQIESVNEEKLNSKIIEYYVIEESRKKQENNKPYYGGTGDRCVIAGYSPGSCEDE